MQLNNSTGLVKVSLKEAILTQSVDYMGAIPTRREFLRKLAKALDLPLDLIIEISPVPVENETASSRGAIRYGRYNYGEIVECMIKAWLKKYPSISTKGNEDFRFRGERIECKAIDRFASPSSNHFRTRTTWLVVNSSKYSGIYSTTYDKLVFNSHNHLKLQGFEDFTLIKAI